MGRTKGAKDLQPRKKRTPSQAPRGQTGGGGSFSASWVKRVTRLLGEAAHRRRLPQPALAAGASGAVHAADVDGGDT